MERHLQTTNCSKPLRMSFRASQLSHVSLSLALYLSLLNRVDFCPIIAVNVEQTYHICEPYRYIKVSSLTQCTLVRPLSQPVAGMPNPIMGQSAQKRMQDLRQALSKNPSKYRSYADAASTSAEGEIPS